MHLSSHPLFSKVLRTFALCFTFFTCYIHVAQAQVIYGLSDNNLISFSAQNSNSLLNNVPISGIALGQVLSGLDFRPATGELYSMGYNATSGEARLYTINRISGLATPIGAAVINLGVNLGRIGFDFNPTVDRIRVTGSNNANFRLHPVTGAIAATDTPLAFATTDPNTSATPNIGAIAYTNSFIGAATTTLYNYDVSLNVFTTQIPPNNGTLNTIGTSNISLNSADLSAGFDIVFDSVTQTNLAYFAANTGTSTADKLYTVNLTTGNVTLVGNIGTAVAVNDIAVLIERFVPLMITGDLVYGLTNNNSLITFDSEKPGIIRTIVPVTGIAVGQVLSGLDFRPATGELYGIGYNAVSGETRLYTIDRATGVATPIGAAAINLGANLGTIGMDFNPVVDRVRVTTASGGNFRLHPETGALAATDTNLAFATGDPNQSTMPMVGTSAYTNSFKGTTATTLYNITQNNVLTTQIPPNSGTLNTIGNLGITLDATDRSFDLDILYQTATMTNLALVAANTSGKTADALYSVNLSTGAASAIGNIGLAVPVKNIAILARRPDLSLSITANTSNYTQYSNVTYSITVTNTGRAGATGVSVDAGLPNGMVFVSSTTSKGSYSLFFERWDVGALAPNESATLTLVLFTLVKTPNIVNFVQVLSQDQPDMDGSPNNDTDQTTNEDDEASVTILGTPLPPGGITADLSLTASAGNNQYDIYVPITYTVTLSNNGSDAANFIEVRAGLPQGFVFSSSAVTSGEYSLFHQRWSIPTLAAGQSVVLTLVLFPLIENAPVNNFFQVIASGQSDPDSTPNNGVCCTSTEDDEANVLVSPSLSFRNNDDTNNSRVKNEVYASAATLFPNPANSEIRLQLNAETTNHDASVRVLNALGKVVYTRQIVVEKGGNEWVIDVANLSNGLYFVQLPTREVLRFIKID